MYIQRKARGAAAGLVCATMVATVGLLPGAASADDPGNDVASLQRAAAGGRAPTVDSERLAASRAAAVKAAAQATAEADGDTVPLVVGFKPGVAAAAVTQTLGAAGPRAKAGATLASPDARRLSVPAATSAEAIAKLRADPDVAFVEKDGIARITAVTPNDPHYPTQTELPQITVPGAWDRTTGSAAVTVAVLDTGVTDLGGELSGRLLRGWDFINGGDRPVDDHGHGSAVAAVIGARGDNGVGTAGVCWQCRILPVKVMNAQGRGSLSTIADGVRFATASGARIINMSLGGYGESTLLRQAVAEARARGVVVIASAGNDALPDRTYPAAYPGVIAVGGTDSDGYMFYDYDTRGRKYGSNFGSDWVDVAAPWCTVAPSLAGFGNDEGGTDTKGDNYGYFCGTSASAPLVSGIAALTKSRYPAANQWSLENSLTRTAGTARPAGFVTHGEVRADRAVITVDTVVPRVTGATPKQATRFRGTVTVGATGVSDTGGAGVAYAALYADGKLVGRDATSPYAVRYNSGKRNGTVRLQWRVYDRAGNSAAYNRALIADNAAPKVKVTKGPKNGAKVRGTVTVKASASDASGIARVELLINGKVVAKDTRSAYSFKVKVSKYGKKIKMQVRAVDKLGNTAKTTTRTWKR